MLAIRYSETPSRGVAALRMGPICSCGASPGTCSCGSQGKSRCGSGSTGCSCGTPKGTCGCGKAAASTSTAKPRNTVAECEPTVICEGYSFDVFPAPKPPSDKRDRLKLEGPL